MKIILASGSPRRREILESFGFEVTVVPSAKENPAPSGLSAEDTVQFLAVEKGLEAKEKYFDEVVVSADTVVVLDSEIMGKPRDKEDAKRMLSAMSGRTHRVLTAYAVFYKGKSFSKVVSTEVRCYPLSDEELEWYLDTNEPYDKAGAYAIQGLSSKFVRKIDGCYFNVVGLPIFKLYKTALNEFGVRLY